MKVIFQGQGPFPLDDALYKAQTAEKMNTGEFCRHNFGGMSVHQGSTEVAYRVLWLCALFKTALWIARWDLYIKYTIFTHPMNLTIKRDWRGLWLGLTLSPIKPTVSNQV